MANLQLAITAFGGPETLKLQTTDIPVPADNQVLVKVAYAGVNPIDAKTRAGLGWGAEKIKDSLPWVPGFDVAGIVARDAGEFKAGDRVVGRIVEGGGYGQYLCADKSALARVPDSVPLEIAATFPVAGLTALQVLEHADVRHQDRVLILAGAGGVGHIAIQLANINGATVYASCSTANVDFVSSLGAEAVDYHKAPVEEQVKDIDVLIDLMGGDVGEAALQCVKPSGRVVTVPTITAPRIIEAAKQRGIEAKGMLVQPSVEDLDVLLHAADEGKLRITISATYPLKQGVQAHKDIESGRTRGKIILEIPQ
ncbi:NADP-dependent oxidoreductase [Enterovibrio paralichthyis]|uniref:NADP-dependent oxidoreductase n=1 Tax=Enterovibrio paralichthyis TaxID=2853805 RepID=UPI001C455093|nr:NADP-dependent oxidoreductase [Enterovibrio paralichthyis]MBV7297748.1 NADP-dependent oxidoreductase [Enterovibrio paralichthyis]